MTIDIQNDRAFAIREERLRDAAQAVLHLHQEADASLTIVITDNESVKELNRQYRGIDAPTDVLSFPSDLPPEAEETYLGDLIIAYPYARAQAEGEGHPLDDSLSLLVVHGTLHLLGYDHDTMENRTEMWSRQAEALQSLGISTTIVPALEAASHDEDEEEKG
ncbi:MAG: rRNA maturation RNase YbeY [Chloroflexota bacterium]